MTSESNAPEQRSSVDRRKTVTLPEFVLRELEELSEDLAGEHIPTLVVRACEDWVVSENYRRLKELAKSKKRSDKEIAKE